MRIRKFSIQPYQGPAEFARDRHENTYTFKTVQLFPIFGNATVSNDHGWK